MAIAAGSAEDANKAQRLSSANFVIMADEDGLMMDQFGLRDGGGNPFTGEDVARPATALISRKGKLLWAKYAQNYRVRMTADELLNLSKKALAHPSAK
jgi:peroxiredoxin